MRRLDPRDKYFNIILPWGKYRFCVLPQGTCVSPEIFDIKTSKNIRNETGVYKNADDVMGGGQKLEELDVRMRKVFQVCRERGIKLTQTNCSVEEGSNSGA